jgi:hypothetical protein
MLLLLLLVTSWLISPTSARDVNLAWDRSTSDVGNGTYRIYWGNATATYPNVYDYGNVTTASVLGLPDAQDWYFVATYRDSRGESSYSNEVFVLTQQESIASATDVIITWQQTQEPPMSVALVTSDNIDYGYVSNSINTTGADLIIVVGATYSLPTSCSCSDNKSSTWTPLTVYGTNAASGFIYGFYSWGSNLNAGTGHQFTLTWTGGSYPSMVVAAFSGLRTTSNPYDNMIGINQDAVSDATMNVGTSITPSAVGDLIVALGWDGYSFANPYTIGSSFAVAASAGDGGNMDVDIAYWVSTSTSGVDPVWTLPGSTNTKACALVSFVAAAGGSASILRQMLAHH